MARLAGVRSVVWGIHHTKLERGKAKRATILIARLSALLSRWIPRKIVCCAHSAAMIHESIGYAPGKMAVVHNGYDFNYFERNTELRLLVRRELGIPEGAILIGMVARFDSQKDHHNLLSALSRLQRQGLAVYCLLVGRDVDQNNERLMDWIRGFGLDERVFPLGQRSDVAAVMNALDVHVLSSCGEAFPNVVAEAMACGVPCVTTDVGDAAVIVGDTGWIVPAKNAIALADGLTAAFHCLADSRCWEMHQLKAHNRIRERFSIDSMVAGYHRVWDHASRNS
jgi:glycosyltransferase involved in cell wall biosynthesis